MARLLRAQAARAQQALASAVAGRRGVSWSFRVARGPVAATLVEVAHETDLLALGVTYVSVTTGRRLGSTARAVLAAAPRPLLLSAAASRLGPPYALVYDGSRAAQRALAIARELVTVDDTGTLSVVLVGPQNHLGALREDLEARLAGSGIRAEYRTVSGAGPTGLMRALRACAPGSAILPAGTALLTDAALEQLLPTLRCALLIVP
jgi:nucleotide-binding universal stress UspA family protein